MSTARCSAACSGPGSIAASVVTTASIVAMAGASIAAPFAIPPTTAGVPATLATASLRTVSVVRIASAAARRR